MKILQTKTLILAAAIALALCGSARAGDFWDAVATTPTTVDAVVFDIHSVINQATITATWSEAVGAGPGTTAGVFDGSDSLTNPLSIYDRNGVLVLQSPVNIDRAQLDAWATANAETIFNILFPAGISELSGATDDNALVSTTVSRLLFSKTTPASRNKKGGEKSGLSGQEEAQGDVEYQALKVAGNHGRASTMILGFGKEMDSGLSYSLTIPYRYTKVNDDINSRSHFLGMDLALKYPVAKWESDRWYLGGCLFGSAYYLRTDSIEEAGNYKYGGGLFTSLNHDLGFGTLGVGVDYRLAKAYMPSYMNNDNYFIEQASGYINHHSPIQILSYGFNLGVPVAGDAAAINIEAVRSNFIGNDVPDDQEAKTTVTLAWTSYLSDTFELNLGISRDFEMNQVDSMGVMLGVVNRF